MGELGLGRELEVGYGHDTERGHGGCDGYKVEARSTAMHPRRLVGWLVVETRGKRGKR